MKYTTSELANGVAGNVASLLVFKIVSFTVKLGPVDFISSTKDTVAAEPLYLTNNKLVLFCFATNGGSAIVTFVLPSI